MTKDIQYSNLTVRLPRGLHNMVKKLAIDENVTVSAIVVKYFQYLQAKEFRERGRYILNEHSSITFPTYATNPKDID